MSYLMAKTLDILLSIQVPNTLNKVDLTSVSVLLFQNILVNVEE